MDIVHLLALVMSDTNIYFSGIKLQFIIKIKSVCFDDIDYTNVFICKLESEDEKNIVFLLNWMMKGLILYFEYLKSENMIL